MKLIHEEKNKKKIKIEDNEDLWTLNKIINEDDIISASTTRVIKKEEREGIRKPVYLTIKAEKIDFIETSFTLKIIGKVINGPEDVPKGSYHSFNINPGDELTIEKEWTNYDQQAIQKGLTKTKKVLALVMDNQEATQALITNEIKELFTHESVLTRKEMPDYTKKLKEYYKEVMNQLINTISNEKPDMIIIAGPGSASSELIKSLSKELKNKIISAHTNHTRINGVKELINSGVINKALINNEIINETEAVNEFLKQLSKDKLIKYGIKQVEQAVNEGIVKTLLISEQLINESRQRKTFKELETIISTAEKTGSKVEFISQRHDAGKQFHKLSGIGAILRY